ncbi:unnamed protein product [Rotaria sordida]|uniref:F-box domain-containing protein n=1 Tax=Rotaria sordida TaxID=392033 RepID=A0A815J1P2_9BILA|nr:unnamed protein product [Rotaria sordida]CAF3964836.1 unnamed protein product [Rotaria sordida]
MNISNKNHPNIFDLPNEILFIIINKLNIVDVFYSLVDVNERCGQLVLDPLYIENLDITVMTMNSFYDRTFSVHEQVLSSICENILPKIHDQVKKLAIEQDSVERILTFNYSQRKLPKLKCFSLTSINYTHDYDEQIIPLLRRMINLEELILFLSVIRVDSTVIGGIELYYQVLIHMSHLKKFVFSINTGVLIKNNKIDVPSNEDIQHSFIGREYGQVGSYVHFKPRTAIDGFSFKEVKAVVKSHIYSLPYQFEHFLHLNNSFQGGMFVKVRCLTMTDTSPFEHQLFKIISDDFPFLKELNINNIEPQKEKQHPSTLIYFPHLNLLNLVKAHVDYAEQFLVDTNTHLPCLLDLCIEYESLTMVTNNFTNNATRLYCGKLKGLHIDKPFVRSKHFDEYFPLLL